LCHFVAAPPHNLIEVDLQRNSSRLEA